MNKNETNIALQCHLDKANSLDSMNTSITHELKKKVDLILPDTIISFDVSNTTPVLDALAISSPLLQDKRKWEESFTIAEKKELEGNIVKAAKDNDGENYHITLQQEEFVVPSLVHEDDSQESDDLDHATGKKPGRKPIANEENPSDSDQDPMVKRKVQNRAAQRAFRERKERYVKELEIKIKQSQDAHFMEISHLLNENQQLKATIQQLEAENIVLKGLSMPYSMSNDASYSWNLSSAVHSYDKPESNPIDVSQYDDFIPILSSAVMPYESSLYIPSPPVMNTPINTTIEASLITPPPPPPSTEYKPKKTSKHKKTTHPQPLEYTFSISTPDSLKLAGGTMRHHKTGEPIELIQLYPPNIRPFNKHKKTVLNESDSDTITAEEDSSSESTPKHQMDELESNMYGCHIDTEGKAFCERLSDETGLPVIKSSSDKATKNKDRLLTCPEIWFLLSKQSVFKELTLDQLCKMVKEVIVSSDNGPVLMEKDIDRLILQMNKE